MTISRIPSIEGGIQPTLLSTTGDTLYASSASNPARLGIGSTGQVLTVASGAPSWATPTSGALTKIQASTFSAVANTGTTFDGVFTGTYSKYVLMCSRLLASAGGEMQFQWRVSGSTHTGNNYYGARFTQPRAGAVVSLQWAPATFHSVFPLSTDNNTNMTMTVYNVGSSALPTYTLMEISNSAGGVAISGGEQVGAIAVTGFIMTPASGTISGTVTVYGVET